MAGEREEEKAGGRERRKNAKRSAAGRRGEERRGETVKEAILRPRAGLATWQRKTDRRVFFYCVWNLEASGRGSGLWAKKTEQRTAAPSRAFQKKKKEEKQN